MTKNYFDGINNLINNIYKNNFGFDLQPQKASTKKKKNGGIKWQIGNTVMQSNCLAKADRQ